MQNSSSSLLLRAFKGGSLPSLLPASGGHRCCYSTWVRIGNTHFIVTAERDRQGERRKNDLFGPCNPKYPLPGNVMCANLFNKHNRMLHEKELQELTRELSGQLQQAEGGAEESVSSSAATQPPTSEETPRNPPTSLKTFTTKPPSVNLCGMLERLLVPTERSVSYEPPPVLPDAIEKNADVGGQKARQPKWLGGETSLQPPYEPPPMVLDASERDADEQEMGQFEKILEKWLVAEGFGSSLQPPQARVDMTVGGQKAEQSKRRKGKGLQSPPPRVEMTAYQCPNLLRWEMLNLFPESEQLLTKDLSVLNLHSGKLTDKSGPSESKYLQVAYYFVDAAIAICESLHLSGYWADFLDPRSGKPYYQSENSQKPFDYDERYQQSGYKLSTYGNGSTQCNMLSSVSWKRGGQFIGNIFTDAPLHSNAVKNILNEVNQVLNEKK